ncbi:hypothetical protein BU15DRAFT_71297 [Melanogaster broomeanus]|nr:hypothetical protein BU15DRAFT_71297 [Melanogaster broomeanus]
MDSTLLEHPRGRTFMDVHFAYNSLSNLEPYLQYPQSPHSASTMTSPSQPLLHGCSLRLRLSLQPRALPSIPSASPWRLYHDFPIFMDAPFTYNSHSPTSSLTFNVLSLPTAPLPWLCLPRQHLPVLTSTL